MGPGMQRRSRAVMIAETRAKLIAAARAAFGEKGYAETSMDDLTAAVGLTRGALYHHFGGKEGLLEAVVIEIAREMNTRCDAVFDAARDRWEGFVNCARHYLDLALEPEIQRIVLRDAPAVLGERWRSIDADSSLAPMTDSLRQLMQDGIIDPVDPEALARLIDGALLDAALWIAGDPDPAACHERALAAVDALLSGLAKAGKAPVGAGR